MGLWAMDFDETEKRSEVNFGDSNGKTVQIPRF
jgi:hypothetical protein